MFSLKVMIIYYDDFFSIGFLAGVYEDEIVWCYDIQPKSNYSYENVLIRIVDIALTDYFNYCYVDILIFLFYFKWSNLKSIIRLFYIVLFIRIVTIYIFYINISFVLDFFLKLWHIYFENFTHLFFEFIFSNFLKEYSNKKFVGHIYHSSKSLTEEEDVVTKKNLYLILYYIIRIIIIIVNLKGIFNWDFEVI